jgi:FtsZ-interacting cell division protein ZipA
MNLGPFKKAITILGVVALVVLIGLVVAALWAINKRQENYERVAPATANRWPRKNDSQVVNQKPADEKSDQGTQMDSSGGGRSADLSAVA